VGTAGPPPVPGGKSAGEPAPDIGAGYHLGKYEVIKRIAVGGMAEIFLAKVEGLPGFQKVVAIKRILPQLANKRDFVEMFLDEARIAATLQHPNLVQVYDVGVADGNYFMAMEYLHGQDVRSIMKAVLSRGQRLPLEHALNVMINVASGLHYAHEKVGFDGSPLNIIHRDVTPQNVIVTFEGGVKLLDFGIAKATNRAGETTRFGTLKGKVPYMSPEQCRGEPLDRRTDVFALGIMLYELTVGRRLYKAQSEFEVMKRVVDGRVTPPSKILPGYDLALEAIVMRALEKEREKRYPTAHALQHDLEDLVRQAGLYVSSSALKIFMEKLFGQKIEAWREAQARGKSLGEHLEATAELLELQDGDLEEVSETEASAKMDDVVVSFDAESAEAGEESDAGDGIGLMTGPSKVRFKPKKRVAPLVWAALGVAALAVAGVSWKVVHKPASVAQPPVTAEVPATPAPAPVAPPPPAREVGIATVKTTPPGATLYLDGKKIDPLSPTTLADVDAGEHTLLVQLAGHKDAQERFALKAKEVTVLDVKLEADAPPPVAATGKGKKGGRSSSKSAASSKAAPAKAEAAAAPAKPEVKLTGEGTLVVASSPWCNVSIDGADKGPTPVSAKVQAGKHTVVLSNPEFKISRTLSVMVQPGETVRKKLDFSE
jgi:serine/threonine protein kinase